MERCLNGGDVGGVTEVVDRTKQVRHGTVQHGVEFNYRHRSLLDSESAEIRAALHGAALLLFECLVSQRHPKVMHRGPQEPWRLIS